MRSQDTVANNGKQEWQVVNQFHEIGGTRQREVKKTFASQVEAKKFFDEQAAKFRKMVERLTDTSIKQSESELQIHVDGVQIVKMSYLAVPPECAWSSKWGGSAQDRARHSNLYRYGPPHEPNVKGITAGAFTNPASV